MFEVSAFPVVDGIVTCVSHASFRVDLIKHVWI